MPRPPWPLVRALSQHAGLVGASDADLLARFAADRDPAAFELLVWRHGRMVLAVCRRVLGDPHRADDAFQATFLILARKAGSVRGSAAGYLHRVARRTAVRAAKRDAVRSRRETSLTVEPFARADAEADPLLRVVLDEEIDRLPDRLRLPVVMCYLDSRSTEEAAGLLGVPRSTVLSRLSAARTKLAGRLTRRGVAAPAAGLAATFGTAEPAMSGAAVAVIVSTVGRGTGTGPAFLLAGEVMRAAIWQKLTAATMAAVLVGGTGVGVVRLTDSGTGTAMAQATDPPAKPAEPTPNRHPGTIVRQQETRRLGEKIEKNQREIDFLADEVRRLQSDNKDIEALRKWLTQTRVTMLEIEDNVTDATNAIARLNEELEFVRSTPIERQFAGLVAATDSHQSARSEVERTRRAYQDALVEGENGEKIAAAKAHLDTATARLDRMTANGKASGETLRDLRIAQLTARIEAEGAKRAELDKKLTAIAHQSRRLYERLDAAGMQQDRADVIADKLRVLRAVQQEMLSRHLRAVYGLSDLPAVPPAGGADRLDQLARDVADLKAALRTADGQDKLDALRQAVDALKKR